MPVCLLLSLETGTCFRRNVYKQQRLTGNDASGVPNLNLTPEEKRVYGQLFRQADTESVGVVTGDVAVKFFEKTRLDSRVLGEVSSTKLVAYRKVSCRCLGKSS